MANYQGMIAGANNMAAQQRDFNPIGTVPMHNQVMPNPTPVPGQPMAMPQIPRPQVPAFGQVPDVRARIAQALAMRQQMNPNFNPAQFGFPNA